MHYCTAAVSKDDSAGRLDRIQSEPDEQINFHLYEVKSRDLECGAGARASFFAFIFPVLHLFSSPVLELLSAPVKLCFHPVCFNSEFLSATISCVEDFASSWKISLKPFDRMSTPVSMEGDNIEAANIEIERHDDHLHSYVGS
ncbi:hypothetical protein KFK09_016389 [Dendrobium nobile]|uniref:Uncharacterized protein n=1 Tax=Dendrobium nobile TaxID=94219 RepID=A0A8T3AZF8_DENNO|nr:hypothetical protein KFK09_016389 [Dendrobium nobile]